mgnify:CR=1 FL=1
MSDENSGSNSPCVITSIVTASSTRYLFNQTITCQKGISSPGAAAGATLVPAGGAGGALGGAGGAAGGALGGADAAGGADGGAAGGALGGALAAGGVAGGPA